MARKRMFNNEIVSSDKFLDMAISTQCLYFHLCMQADDDGFVSPKRIMRMIGSTDDELRMLAMKGFVLAFNDGVIVITHWKINNNEIKGDRYKKTLYQEHLKTLTQYNKVYALELGGVQNGRQMEDQSRLDKNRIDNKEGDKESSNYNKQNKKENDAAELDLLNKLVEDWNNIKTINNKKGLPKTIVINDDTKATFKKKLKEYGIDNIKLGINNYCRDIEKRVKNNNNATFYEHRFTLYQFLKQHNGLDTFINKN